MNFNTFLYRFGFDPEDFVNEESEPIRTENGFIYEVRQRTDGRRECPYCQSSDCVIKDYYYTETNCSETDQIKDVLRIRRVRFKCRRCLKTFSLKIRNLSSHSRISGQTMNMICNDFFKPITFSQIAERYFLSKARILQIFDEKVRFVPRRSLGEVLCIDEIGFRTEHSKYVCVLYDFFEKKISDILISRQLPYLNEYFQKIPEAERKKVKYFISDMYDGYKTVRRRYFSEAMHIADMFHVISQMTNAVNRLRTAVMNAHKDYPEYTFMKSHWKSFLCRREDVPDKHYTLKSTGEYLHYDELMQRCLLLDKELLEAHNILQDLYHYSEKDTFKEAQEFVRYISERLLLRDSEILRSVGRTYKKWEAEIANGIARNQNRIRYTNSIGENLNNQLKTIIKAAYGYQNFDRFRKRAMMIITYKA
ncbi:MAG: ISL3 family transposase [Erysipelotrichaceae bacterium]|jgi:transposase|nr:ISL3 family transposase [Erysipelotrichaceae bacterium]